MAHQAEDGRALTDGAWLQVELLARAERLRRYVEDRIPDKFQAVITPEDVLQEVWIAALSSFPSYSSARPDGLDRWLMGITNHKLIDFLKSAGRTKRGGDVQIVPARADRRKSLVDLFERVRAPGRTPSREVAASEAVHAVQIALSQLPADWRKVIQMKYLEGQSLVEIGHRMRKTEAAVHSLLYRALQELRARLGDVAKFFSDVRSLSGGA